MCQQSALIEHSLQLRPLSPSSFLLKFQSRNEVQWCSVGNLGQTNSPTLARHEDDLGFIRIWATLSNRLIFWDGAPSPYKWRPYPELSRVYGGDVRSPRRSGRRWSSRCEDEELPPHTDPHMP